MATEGVLFGMGNPLLDISAVVDKEFLKKHDVKFNGMMLAEPQHDQMYQELADKENVEYIPREATLCSLKVAQRILNAPGATSYIGCIGKDKFGAEMMKNLKAPGVNVHYYEYETKPTATCALLVVGDARSLVANFPANWYRSEHLKSPENWALVEKAKFFYIAGSFLTVSPESIQLVAEHASQKGKIFMMNLAALYLYESFTKAWMNVFPYMDYVFGDETEARTFARWQGWETDNVEEIALKMSALPKATGTHRRIAVITQGANPVVVAKAGKVTLFPVILIPKENTVDTNGAGDAFVGGFLAQLVLGKSIKECVKYGNFAAHAIIQRSYNNVLALWLRNEALP